MLLLSLKHGAVVVEVAETQEAAVVAVVALQLSTFWQVLLAQQFQSLSGLVERVQRYLATMALLVATLPLGL
jgi:hypothetical protein